MKSFIAKFEKAICCESCKISSIADHAGEDVPLTESDFEEIAGSEILDSIYSHDSLSCFYCGHDFDADGEIAEAVELEASQYQQNLNQESAWLNNQRR